MFTGIVAGTAPIVDIGGDDSVRTFSVDLNGFDSDLEIGASVSLDGVCMTVVNIDNGIVSFDAISETLDRTTLSNRMVGDLLNVERSLRLGDELGGHILSGHIIGTVCCRGFAQRKSLTLQHRCPSVLGWPSCLALFWPRRAVPNTSKRSCFLSSAPPHM